MVQDVHKLKRENGFCFPALPQPNSDGLQPNSDGLLPFLT